MGQEVQGHLGQSYKRNMGEQSLLQPALLCQTAYFLAWATCIPLTAALLLLLIIPKTLLQQDLNKEILSHKEEEGDE